MAVISVAIIIILHLYFKISTFIYIRSSGIRHIFFVNLHQTFFK